MAAEILRPRVRVAHNSSGANLVSGRRLHPPPRRRRAARPLRGRRGRASRGRAPRPAAALLLGNLFRDQLDRYGELELVAARWREAVASLPDAELVVNGDDPQVGDLGSRPPGADLRSRRPETGAAGAAARRRLEVLPPLRHPVRLRGRLRRAPRRLPLPELRPRTAGSSTWSRARSSCTGSTAPRSRSRRPKARRAWSCRLPGLYNVYNALGAGSLAPDARRAARRGRDRPASGFSAAFGRFERIAIGDRGLLMLLIKNPAGANEAVRTLVDGARAPRRGDRAQRRDRRRPRRLLDLGRRLRAARSRASTASSPPARGPRSSRCASPTAASRASGSRSSRRSRRPSTAASS